MHHYLPVSVVLILQQNGWGYEHRRLAKDRPTKETCEGEEDKREWVRPNISRTGSERTASYTNCKGIQGGACGEFSRIQKENGAAKRSATDRIYSKNQQWGTFPTQPGICGRDDGIPNRVHRLEGLGNAVVPQVVLQIFKAIEAYDKLNEQ